MTITPEKLPSPNAEPESPPRPHYFLGCPIWACDHWRGNLYTARANRDQFLNQYSSVFNTVEGNSTFYGLPNDETVTRWCQQTRPGFRFVLKFPREITHDQLLMGGRTTLNRFLEILSILDQHDRLGPSMLQLGPTFDGQRLPSLLAFLDQLPERVPVAVEVRHPDYFDESTTEATFEDAIEERGVDRVLFDSRPLFSAPADDEIEVTSQSRKPRSPFRCSATGHFPMLRLIGRNDLSRITPWIEERAQHVADWIRAGKTPHVFTHAPDDRFAPPMADLFHAELKKHLPNLPDLPCWPGRSEIRQRDLF